MTNSITYYNNNADKYYNNTPNVDMSKIYHSFLQHLPPNALILDASCGSGRDSFHFTNQGYQVEAFDGSEEMFRRNYRASRTLARRIAEFSLNVSTFHTNRQTPKTVARQHGFVFASASVADRIFVKALNSVEDWGPSNHCRVLIELVV